MFEAAKAEFANSSTAEIKKLYSRSSGRLSSIARIVFGVRLLFQIRCCYLMCTGISYAYNYVDLLVITGILVKII